MTRKTFDWNSDLTKLRADRATQPAKVLTDEQRKAQLEAQRNARVNSVMRSGFRQRNSV